MEIERMSAGPAKDPNVLRATITVPCSADQAQRTEANLYRIVDVVLVESPRAAKNSISAK